jgi:putative transposon-encoded protein
VRSVKRILLVTTESSVRDDRELPATETLQGKVKFEVYGEEMLEKEVKLSGNSGRVYLPPDWVGHQVKIIRIK